MCGYYFFKKLITKKKFLMEIELKSVITFKGIRRSPEFLPVCPVVLLCHRSCWCACSRLINNAGVKWKRSNSKYTCWRAVDVTDLWLRKRNTNNNSYSREAATETETSTSTSRRARCDGEAEVYSHKHKHRMQLASRTTTTTTATMTRVWSPRN